MEKTSVKILIVEDEFIISEGISKTLQNLGYEVLDVAMDYDEAIAILDHESPDLVLLDIQLYGDKDGIDLAWKLRETYKLPFIFLTANADHATIERAKQTEPPAYLVKPFNKNDLFAAIEICLFNFSKQLRLKNEIDDICIIKDAIFIKEGNSFQKILFQDILFLESDRIYVIVHTLTKKILVRSSMQQYITLFPTPDFFQIHRGYIVNVSHIDSITAQDVIIKGNTVPIGKNYREDLLKRLKLG